MKQKHLVLLAAVIVIAIAGYFYINRNNEATAPDEANDNINVPATEGMENNIPVSENSNTAGNVPSTDTILLSAQTAGSSVTIDNFRLSEPGFISIERLDHPNSPGSSIGHSGYLKAGSGQDLEINATITAGETYFAVLYKDNGDKKFDPAVDQRLRNSSGGLIMARFTTQ